MLRSVCSEGIEDLLVNSGRGRANATQARVKMK